MGTDGETHVLVVDDEPALLRAVGLGLARHGLRVDTAATGREALDRLRERRFDLLLLDLGLPDIDGLDIIRRVRRDGERPPIVVLSARDTEAAKVTALDLGADDYLTKPFGAGELLARVRVALRHTGRAEREAPAVFHTGDLTVDLAHRLVLVGGAEVHLTPTEYTLLATFVAAPNKVLTDRVLLQRVWGPEYGDEGHYLHVYIARLRKKLGADPREPRYLATVPGVGYRLLADDR
jgi:two-component system KDP operon response regulator KdpE